MEEVPESVIAIVILGIASAAFFLIKGGPKIVAVDDWNDGPNGHFTIHMQGASQYLNKIYINNTFTGQFNGALEAFIVQIGDGAIHFDTEDNYFELETYDQNNHIQALSPKFYKFIAS